MIDIIRGIAAESLDLFMRMSPYLLFGFFFAGVLHILISLDTLARHLGKSSVSSVLKAVALGIPLPLCSCSVIPSAILLRKKGASRGSVLGFLVATPITGIDSIFATYALLGFFFMFFRVVASSVTAFVTGILANLILPGEEASPHVHSYPPAEGDPECCHDEAAKREMTFYAKFVELFRYAFVEILGDVWKWLIAGVLIGGAIAYLIPETFIQTYLGGGWQAMLVMLVVGIPMYVCSTGSIPIAAALMLKGMSPGAALVFLLVGPATNAVTVTVVSKEIGRAATVIYVLSLAVMSVLMGLVLDAVWGPMGAAIPSKISVMAMVPQWINIVSSIVLVLLILLTLLRRIATRKEKSRCH